MREKIKKVMDELMQKNCVCNYTFVQDDIEEYVPNIYALDAYMKAYEMSITGNVECYITALGKGNKAAQPVFSVIDGIVTLSGQIIK